TAAFGAAAAGTFVVVEGVGHAAGTAPRRAPTGSHPIEAAAIPATIWLLDRVPELTWATHRVRVGGVDGQGLSPAELDARGRPVPARLDCTTGWYADAVWTGVALSDLLGSVPAGDARSVLVTSVTGYRR